MISNQLLRGVIWWWEEKRISKFNRNATSWNWKTTVDVLDEKHARMGVIECAKHDLVEPYPVYQEKDEEFVKFTL